MYIVRFEKYVLCFEIGLSPSGSTQSQNKIYTFKPKGRLKKTKKKRMYGHCPKRWEGVRTKSQNLLYVKLGHEGGLVVKHQFVPNLNLT